MTYGIKGSNSKPAGRTSLFADKPCSSVASKSVSRCHGARGSKTDYPYSSTGENPANAFRGATGRVARLGT